MTLMLGIDTGGTYTDAVLYDPDAQAPGVNAKAKALTTRHDLSIGIGGAIDAVLEGRDPAGIGLVSVSTTLATNALVEGQGGRVCLILIGFDEGALGRGGLGDALGQDPVVFAAGGHTPTGDRQAPLDRAAIEAAAKDHADDVDGFAVIAYFGTRDPTDEIAAREIILGAAQTAVTCGHELAASLGGPKRALTALLNARLIGMIGDLIAATEAIVASRGITAPLMLVRGDGSLVSSGFARQRPIETILSGPAASLIGAAHLTGRQDAVISDIGGTTTDIAILRDGRPALSDDGATVGGHTTMVTAVAMTTHGLGGDSEIRADDTASTPRLILGPRRVIPISLMAQDFPEAVKPVLAAQLDQSAPGTHDARFLIRNPSARGAESLREQDRALLDAIPDTPISAARIIRTRLHASALARLVARGLVRVSGLTPSDAARILGLHGNWDLDAAQNAATLMARKRDARGGPIAPDALALAHLVRKTLQRRSAEVLLDAALAADGHSIASPSLTPLGVAALDGHQGAARVDIGLALPLIGLGASAPAYYPAIADLLRTEADVPGDADVANAIGAVVGQVRITREVTISRPNDGVYRVHMAPANKDFPALEPALDHARAALEAETRDAAAKAGAAEIELSQDWSAKTAHIEGTLVFIEGTATVTATGRPRLAG